MAALKPRLAHVGRKSFIGNTPGGIRQGCSFSWEVVAITSTIGQLSSEDLARFRLLSARQRAVDRRADAFSRSEIEDHYIEYWRFMGEIAACYEVDDSREWQISAWTGVITYQD